MVIDDPIEKRKEIVEEEVKVVKKEGDEEEEDQDEDDEEGKKKIVFNPNEFDWSMSNGLPKNLGKVFNKSKEKILYVNIFISH